MSEAKTIQTMRLDGGIACLNFVNTKDNRSKETGMDYLSHYRDLLDLCERLELMPAKTRQVLERLAKAYPDQARQEFDKTIALRELLYRAFSQLIEKGKPPELELQQLSTQLANALSYLELHFDKTSKEMKLIYTRPALEQPSWLMLQSVAELLTGKELSLLKKCPSCYWLFLDRSKNKSRKWCSMATCGDVSKVKQAYHRKKKERKKP
ncbi:CGNR zinc finger domain-containing protein [Chitinophaga niabensis]|nr:CGNR zinc finger domain-containing protein [Chitinophaga niabensis]